MLYNRLLCFSIHGFLNILVLMDVFIIVIVDLIVLKNYNLCLTFDVDWVFEVGGTDDWIWELQSSSAPKNYVVHTFPLFLNWWRTWFLSTLIKMESLFFGLGWLAFWRGCVDSLGEMEGGGGIEPEGAGLRNERL